MSTAIQAAPCPECGQANRPWTSGMCRPCYKRWRRAGFPESGPPIPWQAGAPDELAVEQAVAGYRITLTPPERREAIRQLRSRGLTVPSIADRIGCCPRTVERAIYPLTETA